MYSLVPTNLFTSQHDSQLFLLYPHQFSFSIKTYHADHPGKALHHTPHTMYSSIVSPLEQHLLRKACEHFPRLSELVISTIPLNGANFLVLRLLCILHHQCTRSV